jgi:hypothetical protein
MHQIKTNMIPSNSQIQNVGLQKKELEVGGVRKHSWAQYFVRAKKE